MIAVVSLLALAAVPAAAATTISTPVDVTRDTTSQNETPIAVNPANPSITMSRVYLPERTKQTQLFEGTPKEAAAKLIEKLRFEARVI